MEKIVWVKDKSNGRILRCHEGPDAYFPLVIDGQSVMTGHISKQHAKILPNTFVEGRKQGCEEEKVEALKVMEDAAKDLQRHGDIDGGDKVNGPGFQWYRASDV